MSSLNLIYEEKIMDDLLDEGLDWIVDSYQGSGVYILYHYCNTCEGVGLVLPIDGNLEQDETCPDCFGEGVKEVILSIDSLEHLAQEFDYHDVNAGNFKSLEKK